LTILFYEFALLYDCKFLVIFILTIYESRVLILFLKYYILYHYVNLKQLKIMKKQKLKLGLNKVEVSNLSNIKGGQFEIYTVSKNFLDICCNIFNTGDECIYDTIVATCHSMRPNCDGYSDDCPYTHTSC